MNKLLPHGCDQQRRYPTREWPVFPDTVPGIQPAPAEACTDLGADAEPKRWAWQKTARLVVFGSVLVWLAVAAAWHLGAYLTT